MTRVAIADVEGALRTWMRAREDLSVVFEGRMFFGLPTEVDYPCCVIRRVGGGLLSGEMPIADALIQFDVFGERQNKAQASDAALVLVSALCDMRAEDTLDESTKVFGATVQSGPIFLPDPVSNQARYVVTATVSAKLSTYE